MTIKKTITSIFMVPTLAIPRDELLSNGFINGYSVDKRRDVQYIDAIYVLFQPGNLDKFRVFLDNEYERTKNVIDDYDYEDGYVVVVYKLDPKFKLDFDLVRRGKYSKTSRSFQSLFPDKVSITVDGITTKEISLQHRVFHKAKDLVDFWEDRLGVSFGEDSEVWHGFDEANEILDLDKIRENVSR